MIVMVTIDDDHKGLFRGFLDILIFQSIFLTQLLSILPLALRTGLGGLNLSAANGGVA